ncbi:hypothetical protein P7K49_038150 [Saguinus oedipus]|uniref:Uncharacterized protein n=1 Tax=Saguinus oedipus TaxID=9490 RepID=A0ABQ9TDW0_SAGOE|nr:hypothetical protein P7K49_038150 [Saguinus oedipus]
MYMLSQSTARERAKHSGDYFTLLRHLLNYAYNSNINVPNAEVLLNNEIDWLKRIRYYDMHCAKITTVQPHNSYCLRNEISVLYTVVCGPVAFFSPEKYSCTYCSVNVTCYMFYFIHFLGFGVSLLICVNNMML